jgi:hypothetical protein
MKMYRKFVAIIVGLILVKNHGLIAGINLIIIKGGGESCYFEDTNKSGKKNYYE